MFITYNNSKKHYGTSSACERPERVEFTIKELKKVFPLENFIHEKYHDDEIALHLISEVHSLKYINELQNYIPKEFICRICMKRIKNHASNTFEQFLQLETHCNTCQIKFDSDDILAYPTIDTYFTPHTYEIILNGVYNIKLLFDNMTQNKIKYGYALVRPPGHHCNNSCAGFCIVNNVVIASKYAQSIGYKKILILDYDFHHGDGTENLIKTMNDISFVSIHGYGELIYPGSGKESESENILNIPLYVSIDPRSREYIDDQYYINIFNNKVKPFIDKVNPDMIIVSNGFDGHCEDTLEGFNITDQTYIHIASELKKTNKPVVYISEGGYSVETISRLSKKIIDIFN